MARQRYYHDPARKHIEVYKDFSKGLNSTAANDRLSANELQKLNNHQLSARGSLTRRTGHSTHQFSPYKEYGYFSSFMATQYYLKDPKPQGFFRYYYENETYDEIMVSNGEFYVNGVLTTVGDGSLVIQQERDIEAVQYKDKLYIASGSGLLSYNGAVIEPVAPYNPDPLEALYIGTNGLMTNPDDYIQDSSGATSLKVKGLKFDKRYGVQNQPITLSAFVEKVNSTDVVEYKFEKRLPSMRNGYWELGQDWATDSTYTFETEWQGDVQFKVSVRLQGSTTTSDTDHVLKYKIKPTDDPEDEPIPTDKIDQCNRIELHWDRLILYGNPTQGDAIFISHVKRPSYFPVTNSLRFENPRKEDIQAIVKFRDNLVVFTDTTTQALYGKAPVGSDPYRRVVLNSSVGCVAGKTAKVVDNYVVFLSYEGIYYLKSLGFSESKANVEPIDLEVKNQFTIDSSACAVVSESKYYIVFPKEFKRLSYYYDYNVWSYDESPIFDYHSMYFFKGDIFALGGDSRLVKEDPTIFVDEGNIYVDVMETKAFPFSQNYSMKKLRELHITVECEEKTTIEIDVIMDGDTIASEELEIFPGEDNYKIPIFGKGLETKVRVTHRHGKKVQLFGLGFIFKLKKP